MADTPHDIALRSLRDRLYDFYRDTPGLVMTHALRARGGDDALTESSARLREQMWAPAKDDTAWEFFGDFAGQPHVAVTREIPKVGTWGDMAILTNEPVVGEFKRLASILNPIAAHLGGWLAMNGLCSPGMRREPAWDTLSLMLYRMGMIRARLPLPTYGVGSLNLPYGIDLDELPKIIPPEGWGPGKYVPPFTGVKRFDGWLKGDWLIFPGTYFLWLSDDVRMCVVEMLDVLLTPLREAVEAGAPNVVPEPTATRPIRTTKAAVLLAHGKGGRSYSVFPRLSKEVGFTWANIGKKRIDLTYKDAKMHEEMRPKLETY